MTALPPIKVGFCGYGYSTRTFHLPFVLANKRLAVHAFLQRNEKSHQRGKESTHCLDDYPNAKWYRTPEEFMADKEIELVVVATSIPSHADLAVAALEAGKHGELSVRVR
jgi:predicted dehydrogenase